MREVLSKKLVHLGILAIFTISTSNALAGGEGICNLSEPTPVQKINGGMLGTLVLNTLQLIDTGYQKQGKELKAVFIGRMGTDLGSSRVLSNYDSTGKFMPSLESYRDWYDRQPNYGDAANNLGFSVEEEFSKKDRQARYSHFGIAIKTPKNSNHPLGDGQWVVVHLLRQCRNAMSNLHDEGFWPFFLDDPSDYGSQIIVPKPEIQQRLIELIFEERAAYFLMAPFYNVVAEWNDPNEQNSANWPLEMLALAQMPNGWFARNLDAGAIDMSRFLKSYGELKEKQNNLVRKFASKYKEDENFNNDDNGYDFNSSNKDQSEFERMNSEIAALEQQLLVGYYPIFKKARILAQDILSENKFLPTRFLLKGMAAMADTFMGPSYVVMHGDNGDDNLARATTMLSFREYAERQDIIDQRVLRGIDPLRSEYAQRKFEDPDGTPDWEHFGLEAKNIAQMQDGVLDLCLLGRVQETSRNDAPQKSAKKLNYCKRYKK